MLLMYWMCHVIFVFGISMTSSNEKCIILQQHANDMLPTADHFQIAFKPRDSCPDQHFKQTWYGVMRRIPTKPELWWQMDWGQWESIIIYINLHTELWLVSSCVYSAIYSCFYAAWVSRQCSDAKSSTQNHSLKDKLLLNFNAIL